MAGMGRKGGKKNRKFGRNGRAPCNKLRKLQDRGAKNRERRMAKAQRERTKVVKVPRGSARKARRLGV